MFGKDGNEVVSMNERDKARSMMPLRMVESYWTALRGPERVPLRSEIDPRGIEDALEYAFLAEKLGPSLAKIRVAGAHLNELMGMEVGGMPLSAMFTPAARNQLAEAIPQLFGTPAVLHLTLKGERGMGRPALEGEMIILPLRSDMDDITRALGCLATHGPVGRKPRRFDITQVTIKPVFAIETATTDAASVDQPVQGFAEPPAPFAPQDDAPRKAPHLRLVVSNDD